MPFDSGYWDHLRERNMMVDQQLVARGIRDARVLAAMRLVPRHAFVARPGEDDAYGDTPLPIGHGQTISQPYMVARATELARVRPGDRALEVGGGTGYQAAVLGLLCKEVVALEILPELAEQARANLASLRRSNITVVEADGSVGYAARAPYDVIIVSAGAPRVPGMLLDQLADGGRLVIPLGADDDKILTCIDRKGETYETLEDTPCRYVNLVGRFGVGRVAPQA